jgi:rfaE bifunctional protein kinase chain/domain
MKFNQVQNVLENIKKVKVAVYGDFCLDAYWMLNARGGEISVETTLQAQAINRHYYTLGGASNIVANLSALQPAEIYTIGVIGNDIFGRELLNQLHHLHVDTRSIIVQEENFDTVTFAKRYLEGLEQTRIDFGFFNQRSISTDQTLLASLKNALKNYDVLIFNQQVPGSINNDLFIDKVNELFSSFPDKIVLLDSRHYGQRIKNVYRKTNDIEAARLNGISANPTDTISLYDAMNYTTQLYQQSRKPVFLTRGPRGMLVADSDGIHEIPGIQTLKKVDSVGAGDTTVSALSLSLGAGLLPAEAAEFANFAAAVTVQKLFQTGTASGQEILEISQDANYIYQPQLADDIRQAKYVKDTEIELCYPKEQLSLGHIKHAIFDHDGTISTLRQGWESIMEPMMARAIMGSKYESSDETLYHKVLTRVRDYIDKSTGIQTVLQMEALVEMVKEFGLVCENKILDKFGYKEIYNNTLMDMVNKRIEKFHNHELDLNDYTIKGAVAFLESLKTKEVKLYLASGTDHDDVVNEAKVLGYADLFAGHIYGSVGDVTKYSKKLVFEKIIRDNNLSGSELSVFGDGPVEISESRKCDGIAVGIASDEVRRHGLNSEKRFRLIKAGAHVIIPDFSQGKEIINLCFQGRGVC